MAAGLVSHNITTASGVTFAVVSWVPDTAAPDVGAVPIARITDGTNVAPVSATNGLAVQIIPALPAGTNAIGKLAANSGVDIGDVDVTTVGTITPGVAASSLGKAEDAAHASGDTGVAVWAVRRDTAASGAADGDYVSFNTDDLGNLRVHIDDRQLDGSEYETVAASATTQTLGATGATGDYLRELLIVPATTSPGAVQIKDGAGSAITVFTGGATSVSNLVPFTISLGLTSLAGAWQVTTGTNVSAIGIGNFT